MRYHCPSVVLPAVTAMVLMKIGIKSLKRLKCSLSQATWAHITTPNSGYVVLSIVVKNRFSVVVDVYDVGVNKRIGLLCVTSGWYMNFIDDVACTLDRC